MNADPEAWGIQTQYYSANGELRTAPESTVNQILEALGADTRPAPTEDEGPLVLNTGWIWDAGGAWTVVLESGERFDGHGSLPGDLPIGYHHLTTDNRQDRLLIVAPPSCASMDDVRWWGWTVQLYATRSSKSWGIGDFGDLHQFADFASADGARFGIVNPMHASLLGLPQENSPYYPSSREFRSPLYLRIEDIPGAEHVEGIDALASEGKALNDDRQIKRDDVYEIKMKALRLIWAETQLGSDFETYIDEQGEGLFKYATFCALSEKHGRPWQHWPSELRHPGSPAITEFIEAHADDVRFHQWLQWLCERQFSYATSSMPFVQDLAIGVNPAGADAWLWQDVTVLGARVGAPPDEFNTQGQDWSIPPFDPWKLRAANYEPFIRTVRASLASGGGIRIDHVMGLFRLYWIPENASAAEGAYVRYPYKDMLAIIALEAKRFGGIVVGEDLGTIEDYMRTELQNYNILSYKLLWFEPGPPPDYPVNALGAITTHDLPTIAGLWSGRDLQIQKDLDTHPNEPATIDMKNRVGYWLHADDQTPVEEVASRAHHLLAQAPSAVVAATLEDALGIEERPNYPGTVFEQYPNWSVALPLELDKLRQSEGYQRTVDAFRSARGPENPGAQEST